MVGNVVGHYRILNRIGGGAMGTVYRAEDLKLKRTVALKFLPEEVQRNEQMKKRLIREAVAASSLDHPNICTIFEVDETEAGEVYFSMACYEGETLAARIARGDLATEEIVRIAEQIADALEHAHEKKLVHRDLKPSNIMLVNGGMVKILDFGLVQTLADNIETIASESTSGTPAYMSPEQARSEVVDARTDIWSFGVLLYKMLTGRLPFRGNYSQAVIYSILHEEPDLDFLERSGADSGLQDIVKNCLKKEARERITSFEQISDELKRLSDSRDPGTTAIDTVLNKSGERVEDVEDSASPEPASRNRRKWRILLPASATILLALLIWSFSSTGPVVTPPERRVVAVLPVEVEGAPLEETNWLTEHLRLELQLSLAALEIYHPGLIVVDDRIVMKKGIHDPASAKVEIGATHVIATFCSVEDTQLLFNIELHPTDTLEHVVTTSFSLPVNEISSAEDSIFSAVSALLNLNQDTTYRHVGCPLEPKAYRHYAQAMNLRRKAKSRSELKLSVREFEAARDLSSRPCGKIYSELASTNWKLFEDTYDEQYRRETITNLRNAKVLSNDNPELRCLDARLLVEAGEKEKAEKLYLDILKKVPLCTKAISYYGSMLREDGRTNDAEALYKKFVREAPYHSLSYAMLGYFYYQQRDYTKADSLFREEIRYSVGNTRAENDRGGMLMMMERYFDAVKCFERSLKIKENSTAYAYLGALMFYWQQDYVKAAENFRKSVEMEPDNYEYLGNLAISYYWEPETRNEAKQLFRRAIVYAKKRFGYEENARVMANIALYSVFLGNSRASLEYIEAALALDKAEKKQVLVQAVSVYWMIDDFDQAFSYFMESIDNGDAPIFYTADPMLKEFLRKEKVKNYMKTIEDAREKIVSITQQ